MLEKYSLAGIAPQASADSPLGRLVSGFDSAFDAAMKRVEFHTCLGLIWEIIAESNRTIDSEKPWALFKTDKEKLQKVMSDVLAAVALISVRLETFMPETASKIKAIIDVRKVSSPLFPRLER
jgi:methionyl-tRNA synthetase